MRSSLVAQQLQERPKDCGKEMKIGRLFSGLVTPALQATGRTLDALLNLRGEAYGDDLMCVSYVSGQWYALNKYLLAIKKELKKNNQPLTRLCSRKGNSN